MENYAAGIVLYNPDISRLKENLDAVCPQVNSVYCYNNGVNNKKVLMDLLSKYNNVTLIGDGINVGIATALNRLIEAADKNSINWMLTLDQDSVVCTGMVDKLAELTDEDNIAIACPIIEDVRRKNELPPKISDTTEDIDFCITSGSFMNVKKTLEIGGFDDWLFIGLVDNEICYRFKLSNYRIVRNNAVVLNHELGNLVPSKFENLYLKLGEALHWETIKKLSYKRAVSPMRVYYATRNILYLQKKYGVNSNPVWSRKALMQSCISSVLRGRHKGKIITSICRGLLDGKRAVQNI